MKRLLGLVLAGLVGAGTLFSGVGVAHAEGEDVATEAVIEEKKETDLSNEAEVLDNSAENEQSNNNEASIEEEYVKNAVLNSLNNGSDDVGNDDSEEQPQYQEKVLSSVTDDIVINEENFPDEEFRKYIYYNWDSWYYGTNGERLVGHDGLLSYDEIMRITHITVSGVNNFKGIEFLSSLKNIEIYGDYSNEKSDFVNLDLSNNNNLETILIRDCIISVNNLDLNPNLVGLSIQKSRINSLDLSNNINLISLNVNGK